MQSIIREKIAEQLSQYAKLIDLYNNQDSQFAAQTYLWVLQSERQLESFRIAEVSRLATLRGLMQATDDGYLDPSFSALASRSQRKQKRATLMLLLQQAEEILRHKLEAIDASFSELREKMAQMLAIASSKQPLPAPEVMSTEYLDGIWQQAKAGQDNTTLAYYLQTRLVETDRRYLLQDLVLQLTAGQRR